MIASLRKRVSVVVILLGVFFWIYYYRQQRVVMEIGAQNSKAPVAASGAEHQKNVSNIIESFAQKLNASIAFYGHVEDDAGKLVSGAKVTYSIRSPKVLSGGLASRDDSGFIVTDQNGDFNISGNGNLLTIQSIDKGGFRWSDRDSRIFSYASSPEIHKPDIKNRARFYLFNRSNDMDDVKSSPEGKLKLAWDGIPVKMDMKTCTISPEGELTIIAKRSGKNFEISMQLDSGLLHDGHGTNPDLAPDSGYTDSWTVSYTKGKPYAWMGISPLVFYKKDGLYGKLTFVRIFSDSPPDEVGIYINHRYNQAGRRDLARSGADYR
jgi:hypothetical protein